MAVMASMADCTNGQLFVTRRAPILERPHERRAEHEERKNGCAIGFTAGTCRRIRAG
jgi:hypothetical protein